MDNLMDGVKVIDEINSINGLGVFICIVILMVSINMVLYSYNAHYRRKKNFKFGIFCCISIILLIVVGFLRFKYNVCKDDYHKEYKVTVIDNNIKFNEFTDKFIILSQDGKNFNVILNEDKK